jgi:DNA-binding response OmpR family regulator
MAQASSPAVTPAASIRRGEILLVEDRDEVRQGLAQLLEMHGFLVIEAADADHAMREMVAQPDGFALVVLDLLLNGAMTGMDFRKRQLAHPQLAVVPTIVITASEIPPNDRARLRADGWLEKPFRFDTLLEMVKRHVVSERSGLLAAD